jgi:hypothetical protein
MRTLTLAFRAAFKTGVTFASVKLVDRPATMPFRSCAKHGEKLITYLPRLRVAAICQIVLNLTSLL